MHEEIKNNMAASNSTAGNEGKGKAADHVLPIVNKSFSGPVIWKQIGHLERYGYGVLIALKDPAGAAHEVCITKQAIRKIIEDRAVGEVVTIHATGNEIITALIGKSFRSRTGRALMIRVPYYSGDLMTPWAAFQKVMEGTQPAAPVSIVQITTSTTKPRQNSTTALSHGLEGCF